MITIIYIYISLPIISKEQEINDIQSDYTYIEIKVRGPGYASLFYYNQNDNNCKDLKFPDELNLNNNTQVINPLMEHDLDNEENFAKLIWKNKNLNKLLCLFKDWPNITYTDFSNFYSTYVKSISYLFKIVYH